MDTKVHDNFTFGYTENACPLCCKVISYFRVVYNYKYHYFGSYRTNIPCILSCQWAVYHLVPIILFTALEISSNVLVSSFLSTVCQFI